MANTHLEEEYSDWSLCSTYQNSKKKIVRIYQFFLKIKLPSVTVAIVNSLIWLLVSLMVLKQNVSYLGYPPRIFLTSFRLASLLRHLKNSHVLLT